MLNARYLASLSDEIVKLYADLESDIKANMCKRIAKLGRNSDSIQWQADILAQTGALKTDIDKYISKYNAQAQTMIKDIFGEAMDKASTQDIAYYSAAKRELDSSQKQILNTSLQRFKDASKINKTFASRQNKFSADSTYQSIERMTLTVADSCQKKFLNEMNRAYMKVSSGGYSYDEAIKTAVDDLVTDGVKTVYYTGSGKTREYSVEAAVRMNVITGVNQTASLQTLDNCEDLGTDLVEVSAHIGARPEHEAWQGKIYSISGKSDKYPPFSICRLGEADGLCGINCRHSYYPYFEGTEPRYSKGELDEMKEETVKLDGKEVSPYEAEQELRFTERQIRSWKDRVAGYEYSGISESDIPAYTTAKKKLGEWQARARDITKESGIKRDYSREYVGTKTGTQPRGSRSKISVVNNPLNANSDSGNSINNENITYKKTQYKAIDSEGLIDNKKSKARKLLEKENLKANTVYMHEKSLSSEEIIKYISRNDPTEGSCSSIAFAYAGNSAGFNLLDFNEDKVREIFSDRTIISEIANFNGVKSKILHYGNDFKAFEILAKDIEKGKEYYLGLGSHAAIVRRNENNIIEFLELQNLNEIGFSELSKEKLIHRFSCFESYVSDSGVHSLSTSILIDIKSLTKSKEFIKLLEYINTLS